MSRFRYRESQLSVPIFLIEEIPRVHCQNAATRITPTAFFFRTFNQVTKKKTLQMFFVYVLEVKSI